MPHRKPGNNLIRFRLFKGEFYVLFCFFVLFYFANYRERRGLAGFHPAAINCVAMVLWGNIPPAAAPFLTLVSRKRDADTAENPGPYLMIVSSYFALPTPFRALLLYFVVFQFK